MRRSFDKLFKNDPERLKSPLKSIYRDFAYFLKNEVENVEKITENWKIKIVLSIIFIVTIISFIICSGTGGNGNDAKSTVQSISDDNTNVRKQINNARNEIGNATTELDRGIESIDRSTESISRSQSYISDNEKIIAECRDIISDSKRDFEQAEATIRQIDEANK